MIVNNGQISKGAGYCMQRDCIDAHQGVFLMAHESNFKCPRCFVMGRKVMEYGETDNDFSLDFWQVRIEYNYQAESDTYRAIAIVSDETMSKDGNVYTLYTPLIKTANRAIMLAESLLGAFLRCDNSIFAKGFISKDQTYSIDFDAPFSEVKGRLKVISEVLLNSRLREQDNGS